MQMWRLRILIQRMMIKFHFLFHWTLKIGCSFWGLFDTLYELHQDQIRVWIFLSFNYIHTENLWICQNLCVDDKAVSKLIRKVEMMVHMNKECYYKFKWESPQYIYIICTILTTEPLKPLQWNCPGYVLAKLQAKQNLEPYMSRFHQKELKQRKTWRSSLDSTFTNHSSLGILGRENKTQMHTAAKDIIHN